MTGNVFITGQIGNSYNEEGDIEVKGVELKDVVNQVEPLKDCDTINVWIKSGGGFVEVGKSIASYISGVNKKKQNIFTIADEFCASIATEIHLSVPVSNRKAVAGTEYMIHNPLFPKLENVNTNDLKEAFSALDPIQKNMVSMYVKATGNSKDAIQGLMNVETSIEQEDLLALGFISEVINKKALKAVAFVNQKAKTNILDMNKSKLNLFKQGVAAFQGRTIQAIIAPTEQGEIETPFMDLMVGDSIWLEGELAKPDTYVITEGEFMGTNLIVTEEGVIGEITQEIETIDPVEAQIVALQSEIDSLKANNEAKDQAIAQMEIIHNEVVSEKEAVEVEITAMKSNKSKFTVPEASAHFRKPEGKGILDLDKRREEIRENRKK